MYGVMCISLIRDSFPGEDNPDESRVELEENFRAKHSALSVLDDNTFN